MASSAFKLTLLLACAAPLAAQAVPSPPAPVSAPAAAKVAARGRITGTILCSDTRKPARGAFLFLVALPQDHPEGTESQPAGMTGRANLDGAYLFDRVAPGEYSVLAVMVGYLTPSRDMDTDQAAKLTPEELRTEIRKLGTVVVRGAETETLNLTLTRGAAVSGRVLYSDGTPATQISLELEDVTRKIQNNPEARIKALQEEVGVAMVTRQKLSTDDQGHYRIAGVAPGKYRIAAIQALGITNDAGLSLMFGIATDPGALRFYAGDTLHRKAAKVYELRPGDEVSVVDIQIPERLFHRVRGSAASPGAKAPNGGIVTLTDEADDTIVYQASFDQEGSFEIAAVPPGQYTLVTKDAVYSPPYDGQPIPQGKPYVPPLQTPFAPVSQPVLVKDSDVLDLFLSLKELAPVVQAPVSQED